MNRRGLEDLLTRVPRGDESVAGIAATRIDRRRDG
jgi:hypothetical protein